MPNAETEREREREKREAERAERDREREKRQKVGKTNRGQQSKGGPTETHKGQKEHKQSMHACARARKPNMHAAINTHRKDDEQRPQHTRDMHPPERRRREGTSSEIATLHLLGNKACRRRMHQITIVQSADRMGKHIKNHWPEPLKKRLQPPPGDQKGTPWATE